MLENVASTKSFYQGRDENILYDNCCIFPPLLLSYVFSFLLLVFHLAVSWILVYHLYHVGMSQSLCSKIIFKALLHGGHLFSQLACICYLTGVKKYRTEY